MTAMFLRIPLAVLLASFVVACGGDSQMAEPAGFSLPSACRVIRHEEPGPEDYQTWALSCDDAEHVFMPSEERPLLLAALTEAGWAECGVAAGTTYFRKGNRITTLAFAVDDRRDPSFGEVYVGQKERTDEC